MNIQFVNCASCGLALPKAHLFLTPVIQQTPRGNILKNVYLCKTCRDNLKQSPQQKRPY
jgi:hypothetical protein